MPLSRAQNAKSQSVIHDIPPEFPVKLTAVYDVGKVPKFPYVGELGGVSLVCQGRFLPLLVVDDEELSAPVMYCTRFASETGPLERWMAKNHRHSALTK